MIIIEIGKDLGACIFLGFISAYAYFIMKR